MAEELKKQGYRIIATGEMGIGNTTTSSALASLLLDLPVEQVTGYGAGLSNEGLTRKIDAIHRAINLNRPDPGDPLDMLSKVGGLDIAGMVGIYLGCAAYKIPVSVSYTHLCRCKQAVIVSGNRPVWRKRPPRPALPWRCR